MKIAAYCRVSTDKTDQLNSLDAQKQFFETFTKRQGHTLIEIYADEGLSGTKMKNRTEFLRLLEDAKKGRFEMIVVKDISRFARNTVDFLQSIRALKSWGVDTVFLTANMTALGNSEFVLTIFGALAQEESANTSKRIKFGKKLNAKKGRVPNLAYGYNKKSGEHFTLYIDPHQAEMVQNIYRWYEQGDGAGRIAAKLNRMGERTKRGCAFTQNAICRILTNPLYTGTIINGKEEIEDFLTGKRRKNDPKDWMRVSRDELRIISDDQFRRVQDMMERRRRQFKVEKTRQSSRYLFSTLIRCSECGYAFHRIERTYQNTYVYWRCSHGFKKGENRCDNAVSVCEGKMIDELNRYFLICFREIKDPVQAIQREVVRICGKVEKKPILSISGQKEQMKRKRERILELYAEGFIGREELERKLSRLKEDAASLEREEKEEKRAPDFKTGVRGIGKSLEEILDISILGNARLKEMIRTIQVDKEGTVHVYLHTFKNGIVCYDRT